MTNRKMTEERYTFSTSRTALKPWQLVFGPNDDNATSALTALLTPEVLINLPEPLQIENTPTSVGGWIAARLSESEVLAILDPTSSALIGVIILAEFETSKTETDIHLGYLLAQNYWGKGLASEVIAGLVAHLAKATQRIRLLGGVEKSNPSSARVLQKAGFVLDPALSDTGTEMFTLKM